MRVHELAKELNTTAKELIERANTKLGVVLKSHSATVSEANIDKIRALYIKPEEKKAKPKAFVVKKQKPKTEDSPVQAKEETKSEKAEQIEPKEVKEKETVIIEQPKLKSRLEIVRPAPKKAPIKEPKKPEINKIEDIPSLTKKNFAKPQVEQKTEQKSEEKPKKNKENDKETKENGAQQSRVPIKRHIISQDIYANQDSRNKKKKKEKSYNKEEEQERISLEKAVQSKHKKHVQETQAVEEVKSVVIDRPMTIGELSDKIKKTPAEIIKFLMMQGIMVTVNSPIDIDTAKKLHKTLK